MSTCYAFGSGSYGCLFDHSEGPFNTPQEAAQAAGELFELSAPAVKELADARGLALQGVYDFGPIGADGEPVTGADYNRNLRCRRGLGGPMISFPVRTQAELHELIRLLDPFQAPPPKPRTYVWLPTDTNPVRLVQVVS